MANAKKESIMKNMIGKLQGILDTKTENSLIVNVGGVGYLVFASVRTLDKLPAEGEAVKLYIETHVREDHIHLYGFLTQEEQTWFNKLQTVQGVGSKLALGILSAFTPGDLAQAIAAQDKALLGKASGVGPKLAVRLVTELKDKTAKILTGNVSYSTGGENTAFSSALSALVNLGYQRTEAAMALNKLTKDKPGIGETELIQLALKEFGKNK